MTLKHVIILAMAICAIQAQTASIDNYGIFDAVLNTIKKLRELVTNAIKEQINKLLNLQKFVINLVKKTIDGIKQKIEDFIGGIFDGIREMKEKAEKMGADVSDCIGDNEYKIKQIASKIFLDITQCVTTKAMQAFEILDETVKLIKDLIVDVDNIESKFKNCSSVPCYMGVGVQVGKLAVSLPIKATKLFITTQQTIISITLQMTACAAENFLELRRLVEPAVSSITQCIADKIAEVETTSTTAMPETTTEQSNNTSKVLMKEYYN